MKISSGKKTFAVLSILGTLLLCITAIYFIACQAAPEPGGACSEPPTGMKWSYVPPPFASRDMGKAIVTLGSGGDTLYIKALAEQFGQSGCIALIGADEDGEPILSFMPADFTNVGDIPEPIEWVSFGDFELDKSFDELKPSDVRGACLQDLVATSCADLGTFDLLAIQGMDFIDGVTCPDDENRNDCQSFEADVLLMKVELVPDPSYKGL